MVDFQDPKLKQTNKRRANVPMTPELREILEFALTTKQSNNVVEFRGRQVLSVMQGKFGDLCEEAGLEWTPTLHHIRHSIASWFAEAGVPIDDIADWLMLSPAIVRKVYRKVNPERLRKLTEAVRF